MKKVCLGLAVLAAFFVFSCGSKSEKQAKFEKLVSEAQTLIETNSQPPDVKQAAKMGLDAVKESINTGIAAIKSQSLSDSDKNEAMDEAYDEAIASLEMTIESLKAADSL